MTNFVNQPLEKLLNRRNLLSRLEILEREALGAQPSARVNSLNEFSRDIGDARVGVSQIRPDGALTVFRLNYFTFFSTNITPTIAIPAGALTGDNIIKIIVTGHVFQNTGAPQTLTPRCYIGKSGSETLITSDTALSLATGVKRNYTYTLTISQAPWLGVMVRCNEEFILESGTAGTPSIISRVTFTTLIDIVNLLEVNSCFLRIANGATATMFRIFSDTLSIELIDAIGLEQIHWYDQPTGTDGHDTYMDSSAATTNHGGDIAFYVGEDNSAVGHVYRALIKFPRISNIPQNAQIVSAMLHITIGVDVSSNARTMEAYRILRNWTESGATWNTYDGTNNWGTAGCGNNTTDYDGSVIWGSVSFAASETIGIVKGISLNRAEVKKWIDGTNPNYGLLLKMQTETDDGYAFYSAEYSIPELAPILEVIYTIPG